MKTALVSLSKDAFYMPMGLAYLATYLEKKNGYKDTFIVDARFDNVHKRLKEIKPDLVGISAMTYHYPDAINTAREIRKYSRAQVIIGGFHVSLMPDSFNEAFDFGVMGEGEETFSEVVAAFMEKGPLDKDAIAGIPGLVYKDKSGNVLRTPARPLIDNLDDVPMPDMKYVDRRYFRPREEVGLGMIGTCAPVLTARGCPYRCVYCANTAFWDKYRYNSPAYAVENMRYLHEQWGVRIINIQDDMFTVRKSRLREIHGLMEKARLLGKLAFTCNARSNHIDDEMCELLTSINARNVFFGFESGSERVLRYLKVGTTTVEKHKEAIRTCKRHGLTVYGNIMFGNPGETAADMRQSIDFMDFAAEAGVDSMWCFVATPYPMTGFWDEAKKRGKVSEDMDWEHFRKLSHFVVDNPPLSDVDPAEFKALYNEARKKARKMRLRLIRRFIARNSFRDLARQFVGNIPYYADRIYNQLFYY